MNINRKVNDVVRGAFEKHARIGFWSKANYQEGDGAKSFLLFGRLDCEKQYLTALHELIKKTDGLGIFTKKRSASFVEEIKEFAEAEPKTTKDLKVGQKVRLIEIPQISKKYREGTIDSLDMLDEGIVDLVDCLEENGYQDGYGSCFIKEIVLINDGEWRVFDGNKNTAE